MASFLQKLFSIKNENLQKIITILGLKFRIYNKKLMANHLENLAPAFLKDLIWSYWYYNGINDDFINALNFLKSSILPFQREPYSFWHPVLCTYLACGCRKEAVEVFEKYMHFYGKDGLYTNFLTAKFAKEMGVTDEKIEKACYIYDELTKEERKESFKNYLKGKSIAIVGNGGCELGKNKGGEIDSHDVVIRFNSYSTDKKYIKDYGKKTSVWVRNTSYLTRNTKDLSQYDWIIWKDNLNTATINEKILNVMMGYLREYPKKQLSVDSSIQWDLKRVSGIKNPTSGAIFIYYLKTILGSLDNTDIYGFAFIDGNINDTEHFYDNVSTIKTFHFFDKEVPFLHSFYNSNSANKITNK